MTAEYLTCGHRLKQYIADTSRPVPERPDAGAPRYAAPELADSARDHQARRPLRPADTGGRHPLPANERLEADNLPYHQPVPYQELPSQSDA